MSQVRSALDARAVSLMVLLTALWGFQQVTIKLIAADVSLVAQAALRSILASALVLLWCRFKKYNLFERFVFIYGGLGYANASRMSCSCTSRRRSVRPRRRVALGLD